MNSSNGSKGDIVGELVATIPSEPSAGESTLRFDFDASAPFNNFCNPHYNQDDTKFANGVKPSVTNQNPGPGDDRPDIINVTYE